MVGGGAARCTPMSVSLGDGDSEAFLSAESMPHIPSERKRFKPSAVRDYPEGCGRAGVSGRVLPPKSGNGYLRKFEIDASWNLAQGSSKDQVQRAEDRVVLKNDALVELEGRDGQQSMRIVLSGSEEKRFDGGGGGDDEDDKIWNLNTQSPLREEKVTGSICRDQAWSVQNLVASSRLGTRGDVVSEMKETANGTGCQGLVGSPGTTPLAAFSGGQNIDRPSCYDDAAIKARFLVKRTLRDFDALRRAFLRASEAEARRESRSQNRPDLKAAKVLREKGRWINCDKKIIGTVPGVEVGDQFYFRIEMCVIGLHRHIQGGIDFIPSSKRTDGTSIAISIVASGGYEDDVDDGETMVYTGQGGNNYGGDKRQTGDQELIRGNLALENSYRKCSPVRVIRGCKEVVSQGRGQRNGGSSVKAIYNYDGLYLVSKYWPEKGLSGHKVYKFMLKRLPGQPQLGSATVKFMGNLKKRITARPHLLLEDIAEGKERKPVCVVNEVDDEPRPALFTYVSKILYPSWLCELPPTAGCNCVGDCIDPDKCLCAARNGGEFPYNADGALIECKNVVYECGISCKCPETCRNRVSQNGLKYHLEIFKTENRGWGVRSWDSIPSGGFICEYTGELLSDMEAEQRTGSDEYLFDIGANKNDKNHYGDISKLMDLESNDALCPIVEEAGFTIDAARYGNVARFINHSCSPNLYAQNVVFDHEDLRFPHIMLFATENIPPLRELAYDYNYSVGHVRDADGNVKWKDCYCGSPECQGRLY